MNVVRRDRWQKLGDLEPGMRFRRKEGNGSLHQVSSRVPERDCILANRDDNGMQHSWKRTTLVEHVKGHWQPDEEEEGLVEIQCVPATKVFEHKGRLWQRTRYLCSTAQCLSNGDNLGIPKDTLVRVVHGAFVEGYKETES